VVTLSCMSCNIGSNFQQHHGAAIDHCVQYCSISAAYDVHPRIA